MNFNLSFGFDYFLFNFSDFKNGHRIFVSESEIENGPRKLDLPVGTDQFGT